MHEHMLTVTEECNHIFHIMYFKEFTLGTVVLCHEKPSSMKKLYLSNSI